jgi:exopolysaccharide biosynthesis polyprenyl glycosylphosphotransferase
MSDPAVIPDRDLEAVARQDGERHDASVVDLQPPRNGSAGPVANLHNVNGQVVEHIRPRASEIVPAGRLSLLSQWSVALLDITMLAVASLVFLSTHQRPSFWMPLLLVFDCVAFGLMTRSYAKASRLRLDVFEDIRRAVTSTAVATMVIISVSALLSPDEPSAYDALNLWLLSSVLLATGRIVWNRNALWQRRKRRAGMTTLVVGAGHVGQMTAKRLLEHPDFGLRPIGFLDSNPLEINGKPVPLPVLGASSDLRRVVAENGIDCVLVTFSSAPHDADLWLLDECHRLGVRALVVPRLFERVPSRLQVTHVGALPLLEMQPTSPQSLQFALKYVVDRIVAFVLLVVLSPVLLSIAAAVALSLKRPILYRQHRVSLDGQHFQMLKFRTMLAATEEEEEQARFDPETAPGGVEGTDRRTHIGTFLRRWSLDELPQLVNVFKGEMSLVGPRPERPEYVEYFREHVRRYDSRLRTRAGITGWAQIHRLRGQTSIADRVEWDNYYIENFSLWLDLKILLRTIPEALRGSAD